MLNGVFSNAIDLRVLFITPLMDLRAFVLCRTRTRSNKVGVLNRSPRPTAIDLARLDAWEMYNMHDLERVLWFEYVLDIS